MARRLDWVGVALVVSLGAAGVLGCGSSDSGSGLTCGAGTYNSGGVCVPKPWDDGGPGGSGGSGGSALSCGPGTHESGGQCVADPVEAGVTCGPGTHEDQGACVPDPVDGGASKGQVGDPCATGADCSSNMCAGTSLDPRLVGGYCTVLGCSDTNVCPAGSACVQAKGTLKACFRYCDPGSDVCRNGYVCQPLSDDPQKGICAPACTASDQCPAGGVCDVPNGICTPPPTCDPLAPACAADTFCMPTSESPTGGFCFPTCSNVATDCKASEVCQPFGPGSSDGVCVPPPCATNADCPAGAVCTEQHDGLMYCKPPEPCTTTCTAADDVCVGGLCLTGCEAGSAGDDACEQIHPGLLCADTFGACMPACGTTGECGAGDSCFMADWVCLPTGAFPTSPCLPADAQHTAPYCLPIGTINQACITSGGESICVPECTADADCEAVSTALTCVESQGLCVQKCAPNTLACPDGYACETTNGACLPTGAFPLSPCADGDICASNFDGLGHNLKCEGGACLIDCAAGGDALCTAMGTALGMSLTCEDKGLKACMPPCGDGPGFTCPTVGGQSLSCFDPVGEKACLPTGAFPGSPCKANNTCDPVHGVSQSCVNGMCMVDCNDKNVGTGNALCQVINAGLTCMPTNPQTGAGYCVYACVAGMCPAGYSCFEPEGVKSGAQNACLPNGSFPGGACATGNLCGSYGGKQMACVDNACVVPCPNGESDCSGIGLTCLDANHVCVSPCVSNACDDNRYACLTSENACLPKGSFPGGPCLANNTCSSYAGLPMACHAGTCLVTCDDATVTDAVCHGVNAALTCDSTYTHACMPACVSGNCPTGYSCAAAQNACLPTGSFPGGPCRSASPRCDDNLGGNPDMDMVCLSNTCLIDCTWSAGICPTGTTCQSAGTGYVCL